MFCFRENSEKWRLQQSQEWLLETKAAVSQQIEEKKRRLQNELRINRLWLQIEQDLQQFQVTIIIISIYFCQTYSNDMQWSSKAQQELKERRLQKLWAKEDQIKNRQRLAAKQEEQNRERISNLKDALS